MRSSTVSHLLTRTGADVYGGASTHKVKGKVHPLTGHEGPEGEVQVQFYSFFWPPWRWAVNDTPQSLPPGQETW